MLTLARQQVELRAGLKTGDFELGRIAGSGQHCIGIAQRFFELVASTPRRFARGAPERRHACPPLTRPRCLNFRHRRSMTGAWKMRCQHLRHRLQRGIHRSEYRKHVSVCMALGLALTAPAWAQQDTDARFKQIYRQEWAWRTGQSGISASGESQPNNGRLDQVDAKSQQERLDEWRKVISQLDAIDVKQLSPAETGELRGLSRADPQLQRRSAIPAMADAVQQRLGVLERVER